MIEFSDIFSARFSLNTKIQKKMQGPGKTHAISTIVDVVHHKAL